MKSEAAIVVIAVICVALFVAYLSGYFLFRHEHSRITDTGQRYLSLSKSESRHHTYHYLFLPMLWFDFKLTGQSYDFSGEEHPEYVFTE
jgi:hypothetical protein